MANDIESESQKEDLIEIIKLLMGAVGKLQEMVK